MHILARYRFLRRLGAGAAGGVYLVRDCVLGGPPLALKRVEHASDPALRDSFAREFAVLASLSLPGVARVHDLGVAPARGDLPPGPFFTRDFVDGQPFGDWARERSYEDVTRVFLRALAVVGELHRRLVLHGDLHPGNLIIDAEGQPHLIDFGLASRGTDVLRGSGTPTYMAPELLAGGSSTMSTDIYALAATLWTALAGRAPWSELGERTLTAKLRGDPPAISAEGALGRLLEACRWGLAFDPRERAPSTDELAAKLELALGGTPGHRPRAPFAPPRPRGREGVLDPISAQLAADEPREPLLLVGARGLGKSTLLRELKWRLQLAGREVIALHCGDGAPPPLEQLAQQLELSEGAWHGSPDERASTHAARASQELTRAIPRASEELTLAARAALTGQFARALANAERARVVLIDDLDQASALTVEVLRATAAERGAPFLVGSCESVSAPALAELVDVNAVALAPLPDAELRALIAEALGPVEQASVERLLVHAGGNPGVLLEALAWCWERGDTSALGELEAGAIAAGLAERRIERAFADERPPSASPHNAPASDLRSRAETPGASAGEQGRALLSLLAWARAPLPEALLHNVLGAGYERTRDLAATHGLVQADANAATLRCEDPRLVDHLRQHGGCPPSLALRALEFPLPELDVAAAGELALVSRDAAQLAARLPGALAALRARGANASALRMCEAAMALGRDDAALQVEASELCTELGDYTRAIALAEPLSSEAGELGSRARWVAGRAHVAAGRLDCAVALLGGMPEDAPAALRAQAGRELARAYLRRGESELAQRATDAALRLTEANMPARVELLAIDATLASRADDSARAEARFTEALALARTLGARREAALALGYRALARRQRGALHEACTDYEAALAEARAAGDLGQTAAYAMNLGNVCFYLGQLERVEAHYTLAGRLARRTGRTATALLVDNNLATLHVHLGSFARARLLAEATLAEAERIASAHNEAQAIYLLGSVEARVGSAEAALARYEAAAVRYEPLGRPREVAEIWLDAGELLCDRGGVSDVSAGAAKAALARELIERHGLEDLRPRLRLLVARVRAGHGDLEGALRELSELERGLDGERQRDLAWQVLGAQANLHGLLGAPLLAARKAREAAELIELLAIHVPRDARDAFRSEPRRRAVLELARSGDSQRGEQSSRRSLDDTRIARLLELIKRLARERDLPRLLERITDAAVDLSGAERGFVLLVDATGQLAPHTVRASGGVESDPHVAFSRSIAEAVLIDGEPIVTVNARDDRRLNEFMSVHKLMLKSVACIPISGPSGVLGVLYLEHRLRAGRFQEDDVDLLVAFADQAAIALENARLWTENQRRSEELEAKARELAHAKGEIERLLEARTEELEQVRRDLGRARAELAGQQSRHGIVGQSAAMRRVFGLIERVADSPLPIVIEGESGTGKELVARAIHTTGGRKKQPFVALNCASLPEQLLESELFGHVRGAFTGADRDKKGLFAQAEGGTIFLDEFADMPARMQIDLLRVLQERRIRPVGAEHDLPVDVRVIAASNRPLKQLVASGRLREDLYYRMSVVEIRLPALRERSEDIPLLCEHLLERASERSGARLRKLSRAALERIMSCPLPGNVRQLEHLLTSAAMLAEGPLIQVADLGLDREEVVEASAPIQGPARVVDDAVTPEDVQGFKSRERKRIIEALEQHGWNRAKAAHALGMPRRTFYRRLSEFNIL